MALLRLLPAVDQGGLPLDTRVILHLATSGFYVSATALDDYIETLELELFNADGEPVDAELVIHKASQSTTLFVTPTLPLEAETTYHLMGRLCPSCEGFLSSTPLMLARFSTGTEATGEAPEPAVLSGGSASVSSCYGASCCGGSGSSYSLWLQFTAAPQDQLARIERLDGAEYSPILYSVRSSEEGQVYCGGNGSYSATFGGFGSYRVRFEGVSPALGEPSAARELSGDCASIPRPPDPEPEMNPELVESSPELVESSPELVESSPELVESSPEPTDGGGCASGREGLAKPGCPRMEMLPLWLVALVLGRRLVPRPGRGEGLTL